MVHLLLMLILGIAATAGGEKFDRLGTATPGAVVPASNHDCTGTRFHNHDETFEGAFCWQYGGVMPPFYGAFAEGFDLGAARIECGTIWVTRVWDFAPHPYDLYIWEGGISVPPGNVLHVVTGCIPENIPLWPTMGANSAEIGQAVETEFALGYWTDFSAMQCAYFLGGDLDGTGGFPWTCIVPGIGYPTGWQDPSLVWGPIRSLGLGGTYTEIPTPMESETWGGIKRLFAKQ